MIDQQCMSVRIDHESFTHPFEDIGKVIALDPLRCFGRILGGKIYRVNAIPGQ